MNTSVFGANSIGNKLLAILLFIVGVMMYPSKGFTFECVSNGTRLPGAGHFTIPIDVTINKESAYIALTNMATYTTCKGVTGDPFHDALRTVSLVLSSGLKEHGYVGYVKAGGTIRVNPVGNLCVWPDTQCANNKPLNTKENSPLNLIIGIKSSSGLSRLPLTILAGSELATLTLDQRGRVSETRPEWSSTKIWTFVARTDVIIPHYTCSWSNSTVAVVMPPIEKSALLKQGKGAYSEGETFDMHLSCEPNTHVSMKFTGHAMKGHEDVLANLEDVDNGAVGIQIKYRDKPITLGEVIKVIDNAQATETLHFMSAYYYNGKKISVGKVSAAANVEFKYE